PPPFPKWCSAGWRVHRQSRLNRSARCRKWHSWPTLAAYAAAEALARSPGTRGTLPAQTHTGKRSTLWEEYPRRSPHSLQPRTPKWSTSDNSSEFFSLLLLGHRLS